MLSNGQQAVERWRQRRPEKFLPLERVFADLPRGARIFIGTACAEPQFLVSRLLERVRRYPKTLLGAELYQVWTLGVAPYEDERLKDSFRHNSFFIGNSTRQAVNQGLADYTPIFLSRIPGLFRQGRIPLDIALVQASPPDARGYLNLGIGVDIVRAAVEAARQVVVQVNSYMPRVHGDGFIHIDQADRVVFHDEPLLEYHDDSDSQVVQQIGNHVARLVRDGDTIQVGYGSIPDAILSHLHRHRHLGVHTELITPGVVELIRLGVVDNSRKNLDRGKSVATFCMGTRDTYEYIHDNPEVDFRTVDYTNDPLVIARHDNMVAINSALEIDLTGQATAESIGHQFYSGIGGQADFMRGAVMARNGRTILAMAATAEGGERSRIVPFLQEGAGATLNRGDIYYVVTEYGIAYLHGKNIRQRAMELIAIAHPRFRPWLLEQARRGRLVYNDQRLV
ncbi:MAG: acetyl-CoA hydrolase, partial [Deltaproteobacteria bacterium]